MRNAECLNVATKHARRTAPELKDWSARRCSCAASARKPSAVISPRARMSKPRDLAGKPDPLGTPMRVRPTKRVPSADACSERYATPVSTPNLTRNSPTRRVRRVRYSASETPSLGFRATRRYTSIIRTGSRSSVRRNRARSRSGPQLGQSPAPPSQYLRTGRPVGPTMANSSAQLLQYRIRTCVRHSRISSTERGRKHGSSSSRQAQNGSMSCENPLMASQSE